MAVKFYLSPNPDKRGEHPIRVSISIKGTRVVSTIGYNVDPSRWDSKEHKVKPKTTNAAGYTDKDINGRIERLTKKFDSIKIDPDSRPTPDEIQDLLAEMKGSTRKRPRRGADAKTGEADAEPVTPPVLYQFDRFVKQESVLSGWTRGTLQCWAAFRKHLQNIGASDFDFFNGEGLAAFVTYLRNADESIGKREMDEKTVKKHYSNLRWFLNWCIENKVCDESKISSRTLKSKPPKKPIIYLTDEEVLALFKYQIPANGTKVWLADAQGEAYTKTVHDAGALAKTRDLFCFCARTGLRYSDAAKLKRSDIVDGKIRVVMKKTKETVEIELNQISQAILDKYADAANPFGLALPTISNQKANDYIKDLGELCGFNEPISKTSIRGGATVEEHFLKWQLLSTHAARRSFVCWALKNGESAETVMKWTGHSDYNSMKPYIEISDKTKEDAMKRLDSKINI